MTRIKLYSTLGLPALLCGTENWKTTARDARRKTAAQMKYMGERAGYTWTGDKPHTDTAKELTVILFGTKAQACRRNCLQHVNRRPL